MLHPSSKIMARLIHSLIYKNLSFWLPHAYVVSYTNCLLLVSRANKIPELTKHFLFHNFVESSYQNSKIYDKRYSFGILIDDVFVSDHSGIPCLLLHQGGEMIKVMTRSKERQTC